MFEQDPKKIVDTGIVGNASTGDILFDGGVKINSNFDAIYNAFGDQRFMTANRGEHNMLIHATGYYQKVGPEEFRTPIKLGSMYDVDTSRGGANPVLPKGKLGEGCIFVDFSGSWSVDTPLVINAVGGTINESPDGLRVTTPYSRVECWCVSDALNDIKWRYKITPLFARDANPIDLTTQLTTGVTKEIVICHLNDFKAIKILTTALSPIGDKMRSAENLIMIDSRTRTVHNTEYAVHRVGNVDENDEIINISFVVNRLGYVVAEVSSDINNMKFAIKTIATQTII